MINNIKAPEIILNAVKVKASMFCVTIAILANIEFALKKIKVIDTKIINLKIKS